MARIRIAKATSGAAFVSKKKAVEAKLAAQESGQDIDDGPEDIFELQHHHLLRCLEKTTVPRLTANIGSQDESACGTTYKSHVDADSACRLLIKRPPFESVHLLASFLPSRRRAGLVAGDGSKPSETPNGPSISHILSWALDPVRAVREVAAGARLALARPNYLWGPDFSGSIPEQELACDECKRGPWAWFAKYR
ncbi:voltage-gated potassium channel-like [Tropilaelaps mercedesae]|uniref:Voltage-gated potassium channel-like n=1 Tax=Tropilaelaps mercedesae TaxID=418985 RepID=A0A1V9XF42_9ACAR|nr:voltage-gated potassium channel-like [Tropilaelaps mercedesae]